MEKKYSPLKTVMKALEPPFYIVLIAQAIQAVLKKNGVEMDLAEIMKIIAVVYGGYKGVMNYIKNNILHKP